jgi:hypothetical protein
MGSAVEPTEILDPHVIEADPLDVAAVLLNAVFSDPLRASAVATAIELSITGTASRLASTAALRCTRGRYLTAVG